MTPFEQHIADCIVSEVGLELALEKDDFGDYTTTWVQSKYQAWQAAIESVTKPPLTQAQAEALAHRRCRVYKHGADQPYHFDSHTLLDFVRDIEQGVKP